MELLSLNVSEEGLTENKAKEIEKLYMPMIKVLNDIEGVFNEVVSQKWTPELAVTAKRLRLDIAQVRIKADDARKDAKKQYMIAGNAIQAAYNTILHVVYSKEEKLKEIEDRAEILEKEKIEKLRAKRCLMLEKFGTSEEETQFMGLGEMDDAVWDNFLAGTKLNYEQKRVAEKKAEEEQIKRERDARLHTKRVQELRPLWAYLSNDLAASNFGPWSTDKFNDLVKDLITDKEKDEAEQERIRLENKKLLLAAEKKEKLEKIEQKKRAKIEEDRMFKEAEAQVVREEQEHKERARREALEAQVEAHEKADIKAKEENDARVQAELNKGDAAKKMDLIEDLRNLKSKYSFKSLKNIKMYADVDLLLDKVINHIK